MIMKYFNPGDQLNIAKKKHDILSSVMVLVATSIIFAVSSAITMSRTAILPSVIGVDLASVAISVFGIVFAGGFFFGWVLTLVSNTIGAKGDFFEGLTIVTYSLLYLSFGFLLSGILGLIPSPVAVMLLSFASVTVFGSLAYATLLRGVKELFDVDMLTSFVIVTVVFGVLMFAFYSMALSGALTGSLLGGTNPLLG